jgi:serine/threonine protein kinase
MAEDYIFELEIGHGSFGTVWMARHIPTQMLVAIKTIVKDRLCSDEDRELILQEVEVLITVHHPNIIAFYDFFEDESAYNIVMELGENGNLVEAILANRVISETRASDYLRQIISGIQCLHEKCGILHRDLKCENVLLDRNDNIRIIDFGLSHTLETHLHELCGTANYLPPEMVHRQDYGTGVDIWAAGVILYAMTAGHLPFANSPSDRVSKAIIYADPVFPDHFSSDLCDLLSKMLHKGPSRRIGLDELIAHPFFRKEPDQESNQDLIDKKTIEYLKQSAISETATIHNTASYRIVHRFFETESRSRLQSMSPGDNRFRRSSGEVQQVFAKPTDSGRKHYRRIEMLRRGTDASQIKMLMPSLQNRGKLATFRKKFKPML